MTYKLYHVSYFQTHLTSEGFSLWMSIVLCANSCRGLQYGRPAEISCSKTKWNITSHVWCNIVTGNSTLTVGLVYRSPNISIEENEKIHNAIKEVSKRDCIIMGDFNHGHIQWTSLQSTGREDQEFFLI